MSVDLAEVRATRDQRGDELALAQIDQLLDVVGLSQEEVDSAISLGTADVSPAARKKLAPIVNALRKDPHPFARCMKNLREEQPSWSDKRRKETCNVLKALAGRIGDSVKASRDDRACLPLDDDVAALLEMVDLDVLEDVELAGDHMAVLSAKKRKKLSKSDFVFAGARKYPIHDIAHARNALARSSGKPEEGAVKAAVYKRYPQLKPDTKGSR